MLQTRYLTDCSFEDAFNLELMPEHIDITQCGENRLPLAPTVRLSSGQDMPVLGFGTYGLQCYQCSAVINNAIEIGYRHFDTAYSYGNEREIGDAIRTQIALNNITREDIFLVDKLWNTYHDPKDVRRICCKQLELLGLDYIDLYLLHFPVGYKFVNDKTLEPKEDGALQYSDIDYVDTWYAMEDLLRDGIVHSIGLSNFNTEQIQRIIANCTYKPVVNQVEVWPGFMQKDLLEYCRHYGIVVTAYAPLGQPDREKHTPIYFFSVRMKQICKEYSKKPAQVVLRYLIDSGFVPIPKAANPIHIKQNLDIFDFQLTDRHMADLRSIKPKERIVTYEDCKGHMYYPFENDKKDEEKENEPINNDERTEQEPVEEGSMDAEI